MTATEARNTYASAIGKMIPTDAGRARVDYFGNRAGVGVVAVVFVDNPHAYGHVEIPLKRFAKLWSTGAAD
jgi:hypothetical protein